MASKTVNIKIENLSNIQNLLTSISIEFSELRKEMGKTEQSDALKNICDNLQQLTNRIPQANTFIEKRKEQAARWFGN